MTNIFERASRTKLRFSSSVGLLSSEDLWDLPLTAKFNKMSLDSLARVIHSELKGREEVSFVETRPDPEKAELELKLEILKHIIGVKLEEKKKAEEASANAVRKQKIMAAIEQKQDGALSNLSEEELKAELAKL
jgi:hypothetical protein